MVCRNFILSEICKPCLFLPFFEFAQFIVPYQVLSSILVASDCKNKNKKSIAVELFVAPRYYAFLGAEYVYKETNNLDIHVNITEDSGKVMTDSLALPSDKVHPGISNEYAQTILNTSIKVFKNLGNVSTGVLTFNVGGYSDYGSNQVIFSKVTSILIRLFIRKKGSFELEELKDIVRNELDKPLTDI